LLDDARQRRVMKMANAGKEVMLYLEVEAAEIPAEQRVSAGKVNRRRQLVLGPVRLDLAVAVKLGFSHAVGQLKDRGQHVAEREEGEGIERQDRPGGVERYRQHERPGEENRLSGERAPERAPARSRELVAPDAAGGELDEIEDPPLQREHAVQQPDVEVLAAMMRAPW